MDKYSYNDVIIDPNDPRVEIGKDYYFADYPFEVIGKAQRDEKAKKLVCVNNQEYFRCLPFYIENSVFACACLIRKKESSYVERQAKWLADNDIKVGDYVRVTGKADSLEDGWQTLWNPDMDKSVGKVGTVSYISANSGECGIKIDVPGVGSFFYPYFVLEKVEPEHMPYDFDDLACRASLLGKAVKNKKDELIGPALIIGFSQLEGGIWMANVGGIEAVNRVTLLHEWMFLDGTPCGQEVEE